MKITYINIFLVSIFVTSCGSNSSDSKYDSGYSDGYASGITHHVKFVRL